MAAGVEVGVAVQQLGVGRRYSVPLALAVRPSRIEQVSEDAIAVLARDRPVGRRRHRRPLLGDGNVLNSTVRVDRRDRPDVPRITPHATENDRHASPPAPRGRRGSDVLILTVTSHLSPEGANAARFDTLLPDGERRGRRPSLDCDGATPVAVAVQADLMTHWTATTEPRTDRRRGLRDRGDRAETRLLGTGGDPAGKRATSSTGV